jgi:hypothetical protein
MQSQATCKGVVNTCYFSPGINVSTFSTWKPGDFYVNETKSLEFFEKSTTLVRGPLVFKVENVRTFMQPGGNST